LNAVNPVAARTQTPKNAVSIFHLPYLYRSCQKAIQGFSFDWHRF
jgi:hypothetical protein